MEREDYIILSAIGMGGLVFIAAVKSFCTGMRRSRCTEVNCCCVSFKRDIMSSGQLINDYNNELSLMEIFTYVPRTIISKIRILRSNNGNDKSQDLPQEINENNT